MNRLEALSRIDDLLETCKRCEKRPKNVGDMKKLCLHECVTGLELQEMGKALIEITRKKRLEKRIDYAR